MVGSIAVNDNLEALKRVLVGLIAMAGLASWMRFDSPRRESASCAMPRRLHLAVLRLLRPAESAARRLIIAAARGIVVTLPKPRESKPHQIYVRSVITMHAGVRTRMVWQPGAQLPKLISLPPKPSPTRLPFPLLDPPNYVLRRGRPVVANHGNPRIGWQKRPLRSPPRSGDDSVDATRLGLRLAALGRVLDDLPGQAKRFARWKVLRDRACRRGGKFRLSPLRLGRPPGGRLSRYDPVAIRGRNIREVDEILAHCHALASYALSYPDTS